MDDPMMDFVKRAERLESMSDLEILQDRQHKLWEQVTNMEIQFRRLKSEIQQLRALINLKEQWRLRRR